MKAVNNLALFVLSLMLTVSCQKDEETNSRKEILTSKSWKVSSYKIDGEERPLMDCQKDNYMTFYSNGTYKDFVGVIKCDIYETDIIGTWTLSGDEKTLTLESIQGVQPASVEISESKLLLTVINEDETILITCIPY